MAPRSRSDRDVPGSVFLDGDRPHWYVKYYDPVRLDWVKAPSPVPRSDPNGEERARDYLREIVEAFSTALTVNAWADKWLQTRTSNSDYKNTVSRLRDHVRPVIGPTPLANVTPQDVLTLVERMKAAGKAPRTIRNVYSDLSAMFRDAILGGHLEARDNPCILRSAHLGNIEDKESGWRAGAVLQRQELQALITDIRIPVDRRVQYALLGVAALRAQEAARLTWGDIRPGKPLNKLIVRDTKTVKERWVPIHPTLHTLLEEWSKLWPVMFGRPLAAKELVIPTISGENSGPRVPTGRVRPNNYMFKRWRRDLQRLGFRHRRIHDLRRTFISLAQGDGAVKDILSWATHAAPHDVMNLYTTHEWATVSNEVSKLKISLLPVEYETDSDSFCDQDAGRALFIPQESQSVATK